MIGIILKSGKLKTFKQIEKKVLLVLADRQGQDFPFTGEERDFLSRHTKDLPAALEKIDKE